MGGTTVYGENCTHMIYNNKKIPTFMNKDRIQNQTQIFRIHKDFIIHSYYYLYKMDENEYAISYN